MATIAAYFRTRQMVLMIGPFAIIGCCYWLTRSSTASHPELSWKGSQSILPTPQHFSPWWESITNIFTDDSHREKSRRDSPFVMQERFTLELQEAASQLREELGPDYQILARAPFVLAGDCSMEDLQWMYSNVLIPSHYALSVSYFDSTTSKPIRIIVVKSSDRWNSLRTRWPGFRPVEYAGFYSRDDRCVAINLETGIGSLAHELTHALVHSDFENCPEWFDEGLASLHEECEFNDTGTALNGLANWRYQHFREALERSQAPTLKKLINEPFAISNSPAVEYAHARLFCIYLQHQGVLEAFYRKLRQSNLSNNPVSILCSLTKTVDLDQLDTQFLDWAKTQTALPGGRLPVQTRSSQITMSGVPQGNREVLPTPDPAASGSIELD